MNLAVVNEAVTGMNGVEHEFTEEEKNFVVQFAFRSGSKEDTISLIEALHIPRIRYSPRRLWSHTGQSTI